MNLKWNLNKAAKIDPVGEPEGEIFSADDFQNHSSLVVAAKEGANVLNEKYPGWLWAIQINQIGRMLNIFNHALHDTWGYVIRADEIEHGDARAAFLKAGGEILERFGLPRTGMNEALYMAIPRDFTGKCIPIINDLEHAQAKKAMKKRKLDAAIMAGRTYSDGSGRVLVHV